MSKSCCKKQPTQETPPNISSTSKVKKVSVCGNTRIEYMSDDDQDHHCCCEKAHFENSTKIIAEINIGFGNTLYIRGAGYGLNWEKGIALKNQDSNFWSLNIPNCKEDFEYKLLINDDIWCEGHNLIAKHGQKNIVTPKF